MRLTLLVRGAADQGFKALGPDETPTAAEKKMTTNQLKRVDEIGSRQKAQQVAVLLMMLTKQNRFKKIE